jgi:hypothetical protein
MGDVMKLKDIRKMRAREEISRAEFEMICTMMGRSLHPVIEDGKINFRNGDEGYVASADIGSRVATIFPENCGGDANAERYFLGLTTSQYDVKGYQPRQQ